MKKPIRSDYNERLNHSISQIDFMRTEFAWHVRLRWWCHKRFGWFRGFFWG
jgi:hypothetical protein